MHERRFSDWVRWRERDECDGIKQPGVYVIALPAKLLANRRFSWSRDIVYVGMTNSLAGLAGRLQQFDRTMAGTLRHGGADRMRFKHRSYTRFSQRAYVAVAPFPCTPGSSLPRDLRVMGEVAKFEFTCLATFAAKFGEIPSFNKHSATKFSKAARDARSVRDVS
jgi:hypothetical protein